MRADKVLQRQKGQREPWPESGPTLLHTRVWLGPSCHAHSRRLGSKRSGTPSYKCCFPGLDPPLKASLTPPSVPESPPHSRAQPRHALPGPQPFSVQPTRDHPSFSAPHFFPAMSRARARPRPRLASRVPPLAPQPHLAAPHPTSFGPVAQRLSRQQREYVRYPLLRSQSVAAATAGPQPESWPRHRRRRRHLRPARSAQPRLPSPPPPSTALGNPPATATPETVAPIS